MKVFNDAKPYEINEITKTKSLKDFLLAIDLIDSKFNSVHTKDFLNTLYLITTIEQIFNLIEKFRHIIRMKKENKVSFKSHFAFFIDENSTFIFPSSFNVRLKENNNRSFF